MFTPVTAMYAGLLALFFFYLTALVIQGRFTKRIPMGDNGDVQFSKLMRAHGNFTEYTPLILLLMLIAEINQVQQEWLHIAGVSLLLGRALHSIALRREQAPSRLRVAGMLLTFLALLELAVLNLMLQM